MKTILSDIPFRCDTGDLIRRLCIDDPDDVQRLKELVSEAERIARPKSMFRVSNVDRICDNDDVVIGGVTFHSSLMLQKFSGLGRVFPHVSTCGVELYEWSGRFSDPLERYWVDAIMTAALACARTALNARLKRQFDLGEIGSLTPGSLPVWPITQQEQLFCLLESATEDVGVSLTPTFLMLPTKSVSGIFFATDAKYENCGLCPRAGCPNRRMEYDPAEAKRMNL